MEPQTTWILEGPAWIAYRARRDLLGQTETTAEVKAARHAMLADPAVRRLCAETAKWPGPAINNHKKADLTLHKLVFLADLGLTAKDPGVRTALDRLWTHISGEGPLQVSVNIPKAFGGTGKDAWSWMLCDSPSLLYALAKMGLGKDPRVRKAAAYLAGLVRPNGWPCAAAPELGRFHGPGRRENPCPYANLLMVKALAQLPEHREGDAIHAGAEALLQLWKRRRDASPYLFHMGTDFSKLKAPFIWYDLLHVLEVLSPLEWLRRDPRLRAMAEVLRKKFDADGRATPESIWLAWSDWEFGQKKAPSRWVTLVAARILARLE